jgi:hypothetical protein
MSTTNYLTLPIIMTLAFFSCQMETNKNYLIGHWYSLYEDDSGQTMYREYFFDTTQWFSIYGRQISCFNYELQHDTLFTKYKKTYFPQFKIIYLKKNSMITEQIDHLNYSNNPTKKVLNHKTNDATIFVLADSANYTTSIIEGFKFRNDSLENVFWNEFNIRKEVYLRKTKRH